MTYSTITRSGKKLVSDKTIKYIAVFGSPWLAVAIVSLSDAGAAMFMSFIVTILLIFLSVALDF